MEAYPSGLCFSNFAPAFRSCLGYECIVGHYGNFTKLNQVFEGIPDTAKVCVCVLVCSCSNQFLCRLLVKVWLRRYVWFILRSPVMVWRIISHSNYCTLVCLEPLQPSTVSMPINAGNIAWNILTLLATNKDYMIPLGELAGHYNNAFSHQIKLSNYGHTNMETFLSSLPSIVVSAHHIFWNCS